MAEIEKSLRKALEEKVANLDEGTSLTASKDNASDTTEKNDKVTVWLEAEIVMIIFNFPTKSMQFCVIKAFIKFK